VLLQLPHIYVCDPLLPACHIEGIRMPRRDSEELTTVCYRVQSPLLA
jgi:hypothetical protein